MQGGAGALPAEPAFLKGLRAACDAHKVLLVIDEVMTSRLDPGGVQRIMGVKPDLMTLGKYVGGGLTIGAFGGRADIMARFDPSRPDAYPHGGTFNNNVLAMAAGHAALTSVLTTDDAGSHECAGRPAAHAAERAGASSTRCRWWRPALARSSASTSIVGPIRNAGDLDKGEHGREQAIGDIKKLFHLDMLAAGQYISRRIMGNLSVETSEQGGGRILPGAGRVPGQPRRRDPRSVPTGLRRGVRASR